MPSARERLIHLVDLASREAPEERRRLVSELCELLLDWPAEYPLSMRTHFDKLLERAARDVDREMRAALAERFVALPDAPVSLLNELFFDASGGVKDAILRRNALANDDAPLPVDGHGVPEAALISTARTSDSEDLAAQFAKLLKIDRGTAHRILSEPTGDALAAACKGAHLKRATFSTLALLFAPERMEKEARLSAYDAVPQEGAENLIRFWRAHPHGGENGSKTQAA